MQVMFFEENALFEIKRAFSFKDVEF